MALKKVNVCTICGSKKCNGKEYRAHIKYDYYGKVDYWKTVCYSQTTKSVCSYMVTEETEKPDFLIKGKRYYTFGLCTGMNYATEAIPKKRSPKE